MTIDDLPDVMLALAILFGAGLIVLNWRKRR